MLTSDMEKEDLIGLTEILKWKDITTKRQKKMVLKYGDYQ